MEYQGRCVITLHCAVLGRRATEAGWVKTEKNGSGVTIYFKRAGEKESAYYIISPDNLRFAQIASEGQVIWDSREEVPCDMTDWEATNAKHQRRPFAIL
jgi:hypothetical protein